MRLAYERTIDRSSSLFWNEDLECVLAHVKSIERYLNDTLIRRGILTLDEAYAALGFRAEYLDEIVAGWISEKADIVRIETAIVSKKRNEVVIKLNPRDNILGYFKEREL